MVLDWIPLHSTQGASILVSMLVIALFGLVIVRALRRTRQHARQDTHRSQLLNEIPSELRFRVYERDGYECQRCGTTSDVQVDFVHQPPESGPVRLESLVTRCARCVAIVRQSGMMR